MYRWQIMQAVTAQKVFGIVRSPDAHVASATVEAMLAAGLRSVEITLTTPGAMGVLRRMSADAPAGAVFGAGTVLDEAGAGAAVDAGARFLVAPHLDPAVIRAGHRHGVPVIPGVGTVSELLRALESGADAVKLFPAAHYGPGWLRDVRTAMPQAPVVPTGGVSIETAPQWVAAGAVACGMGSSLTAGGAHQAGERVARLLAALQ